MHKYCQMQRVVVEMIYQRLKPPAGWTTLYVATYLHKYNSLTLRGYICERHGYGAADSREENLRAIYY